MVTHQMIMKFFIPMAFIALVGASFAVGQTPSAPDSALSEILHNLSGTPLALRQAVDYALKNATSVRRAEAQYAAAGGTERKESGFFDPQLFFNLTYQEQSQPMASFLAGATTLSTRQTASRTGVRMTLPIGTQLELGLNTLRLATNSQFAFLNPEYDAFGSVTVRQPLLGGLWVSARKQLVKSERESEAAKARYDQQVLAVHSDVERTYWDLYAAERDYAVQLLTRDRAKAFLNETELRARTGLIGPNQVASAKTFLAEQELQFLEREEQLDHQSDLLASLIGVRPDIGVTRFIPTDEPPSAVVVDSIDMLVDHALKNNLDLQAAQKDVEAARALAHAANWEWLPSVNLVGSLGGYGLAGSPRNDTLSTPYIGNFDDALRSVSKREFPAWSVGVEVSIPIGFRSGLGEKDRLEAQVHGAEQRYIEQSRTLADQVRATHRELSHGTQRLKAARDGVEAAQEQVRIGLIEFHNGRTTAFELVRLGEDFAVAQRRYSEALVRTAKAAATLRQLTSGAYPSTTNH